MGRGSGGAGSGGGAMTTREYNRLASGNFRAGDYIRDKTGGSFDAGRIVSRGTIGRGKGAFETFIAKGPRGQVAIPVRNAVAMGIG